MPNNNNYITLEFDKSVSRLAGFPYGERIYKEQVKDQVDFTKPVVIEFPSQIIKIGSSFVQGFFNEIVAKVGMEEIGGRVQIKAGSEEVRASIFNNLI